LILTRTLIEFAQLIWLILRWAGLTMVLVRNGLLECNDELKSCPTVG